MGKTLPAVVVERDQHRVVAAGENIGRVGLDVETDLYGEEVLSRGTRDSILGEMDFPASINWNVEIDRIPPFSDDKFPMSMPQAIANGGIRTNPEEGLVASRPEEVIGVELYHLHVQEEARRMGYGQVIWDAYVALVAYGNYRANGKVGSMESGGTVEFLKRQGVPEEDIDPGSKTPGIGSGPVKWSTPPDNVVGAAPVKRTQVEVTGG